MKSVFVISALFISLFILGCGGDEGASVGRKKVGSLPSKPQDISKLPLDEAIKVKYEKLNFKCDYKLVLLRPDSIGGIAKTVVEKQFYVWDIRNDFNKNAQLELDYKFETVHTKILWDVEVDLVKSATPGKDKNKHKPLYKLEDAVVLKGASIAQLVEYDSNGVELGSSEIHLNDRVYFDRVPLEVSNSEHKFSKDAKNSTHFNLNCILDAKVKAGFESDFKVVRN